MYSRISNSVRGLKKARGGNSEFFQSPEYAKEGGGILADFKQWTGVRKEGGRNFSKSHGAFSRISRHQRGGGDGVLTDFETYVGKEEGTS